MTTSAPRDVSDIWYYCCHTGHTNYQDITLQMVPNSATGVPVTGNQGVRSAMLNPLKGPPFLFWDDLHELLTKNDSTQFFAQEYYLEATNFCQPYIFAAGASLLPGSAAVIGNRIAGVAARSGDCCCWAGEIIFCWESSRQNRSFLGNYSNNFLFLSQFIADSNLDWKLNSINPLQYTDISDKSMMQTTTTNYLKYLLFLVRWIYFTKIFYHTVHLQPF